MGGCSPKVDKIGFPLDVSMEETHVIVVDRDGKVILETRTPTAPKTIAAALAKRPAVERVLFETGRMAPMLFHGVTALGLPVVCVESRQAYEALRSLAAHKTDRNDARGLAHLARTGFFKPVHVKSLPSHAVRALLVARKKLVGQRVTLENQIRGLAVAFGVRLPRGLSSGFAEAIDAKTLRKHYARELEFGTETLLSRVLNNLASIACRGRGMPAVAAAKYLLSCRGGTESTRRLRSRPAKDYPA